MTPNDDEFAKQLNALRNALDAPPSELSLGNVVPVFVPDALATPKWLGPIVRVNVPGVAITWAVLTAEQTMVYVTHEMAERWSSQGLDWQSESMGNLAGLSEQLSSHAWTREDGTFAGLIMQHDDGIGPSRLLLNTWLEEVFPEGYSCAIPERSLGVALSAGASPEERQRAIAFVDHCYQNGTRPFVAGFFDPEQLVAAGEDVDRR